MLLKESLEKIKEAKEKAEQAGNAVNSAKIALIEADNKLKGEAFLAISYSPLYTSLWEINDRICKLIKNVESNYLAFERIGDDVEASSPYPETEATLSVFVKELKGLAVKAKQEMDSMLDKEKSNLYNGIVESKQKEYDMALKNEEEAKEALKRAYEAMKYGTDDLCVPGEKIDEIEKALESEIKGYCPEDGFSAEEGKIILGGSLAMDIQTEVEDDDFIDDPKDIEDLCPENEADDKAEEISDIISDILPGYCVSVQTEILDADYDGETYHNGRYYERDTGYEEPEGDFYTGTVTCSFTIRFTIIITKEAK